MKPQRFLAAVFVVLCLAVSVLPANAASPAMPSISTPVYPATFHLSGQYTASVAGVASFRMPFNVRVLYVTMNVGAKGGTQGTSTLTCTNATNAFTNAVDLTGTAATLLEATLVSAYQSVAKDALVTCNLVISGGTSPTLNDITLVLWYQRR